MPNVLIYKPLLINLIQNRISYCMSATSLVITLTEKQINVLIIFQAKSHYCSIQFSQSLGDVTKAMFYHHTITPEGPSGLFPAPEMSMHADAAPWRKGSYFKEQSEV